MNEPCGLVAGLPKQTKLSSWLARHVHAPSDDTSAKSIANESETQFFGYCPPLPFLPPSASQVPPWHVKPSRQQSFAPHASPEPPQVAPPPPPPGVPPRSETEQ